MNLYTNTLVIMEDIRCPYCDEPHEVIHDDGYGYEENTMHEMECSECEKTFGFTTSISFYYEAHKTDCKNEDGEHDWQPTMTYPKCFTKMHCKNCWDRRQPTDEEKVKYEIPSYEDELH